MANELKRTIQKLTEAIENNIEMEPTINVDNPTKLFQCPVCKAVHKEGAYDKCPICGNATVAVNESRNVSKKRRIKESDEGIVLKNPDGEEVIVEDDGEETPVCTNPVEAPAVEDEETIPDEVKKEVNEAMKMLRTGNYKKFNEKYSNSHITKKGYLNLLIESESGRTYSILRRMNSIQRANYKLSESLSTIANSKRINAKRFESIKIARQKAVMLREMKSVKVAALRLLERSSGRISLKKLNEELDAVIENNMIDNETALAAIAEDKDVGADITTATPEEIAEDVKVAVEDSGLKVLASNVQAATTDAATVELKVEDLPTTEVNLQDVAETASEILDGADVAIVGPVKSEVDSTVADVTVVVNPTDIEEITDVTDAPVAINESFRRKLSKKLLEKKRTNKRRIYECDGPDPVNPPINEDDDEDDDKKDDYIPAPVANTITERQYFANKKRKKFNEKIVGDDSSETFGILFSASSEDEDPMFLAKDGNLVKSTEGTADITLTFGTTAEADAYIADNGLNGYEVKAISFED